MVMYYRFNDLYQQSGGRRGQLIDREAFSRYFHLPVQLGDRLFTAFDRKEVIHVCSQKQGH